MQDYLKPESNDEIDLRELFITLWAYKLFIAVHCALGIVFGGYYALNADKEFTSAAIFKIGPIEVWRHFARWGARRTGQLSWIWGRARRFNFANRSGHRPNFYRKT